MDNTEFITATEARKKAEEKIDTSNKSILESIEKAIKLDSSEGSLQTFVYTALSTSVINHLKNRGFSIEDFSSQKDGAMYKITW